jgi:UDP:flavonoid glycosyltransferase YjiC (YdhE family)/ubiquinone/menaquinone biosynthesis C-methylase UbiE
MSRILLTTLGSLGDLHPLIAIGLELRRRGHTVGFCTSASYRPRIEVLGFGFQPLSPDLTQENASASEMVKAIMDPKTGVETLIRKFLMPHLRAMYDDLTTAVTQRGGVDLFVSGELVYPARLVAEETGTTWASYITAPMSFFSAYEPPVLAPVPRLSKLLRSLGLKTNQVILRLIKSMTRDWSEPVHRLRAELGLPPGNDPIYEGKHSPELVLALFSPELAKPQPDWPQNTVVTGFPFYCGNGDESSLPQELMKFLKAGEPPIVFTLGSSAVLDPGQFYRESARAACALRRRAVLLIGRNPPLAALPPEVVSFPYVGFSELFPQATVIVHQGGVGTTGQALRAGRPMLVMPYNYDQPDNADRITRLGVGRTISRKAYSAERVERELEELLTKASYTQRAKEIGERVRRERGAETACDALERLLGSRIWNARTFDGERRRLVPCFDQFYGTAVELVARTATANPRILELGAGTGLLGEMVANRVKPKEIHLLDASQEMLARAQQRLAAWKPTLLLQQLTDTLPPGPYDAVVSALAIHHIDDSQKRDLLVRIYRVLAPGGLFVNAEQILGPTDWHQKIYEATHLEGARTLGSSEEEIAQAEQRMRHDQCAPLADQIEWLRKIGYERPGCFFHWFRFAVYAGWKPA